MLDQLAIPSGVLPVPEHLDVPSTPLARQRLLGSTGMRGPCAQMLQLSFVGCLIGEDIDFTTAQGCARPCSPNDMVSPCEPRSARWYSA